MRYRIVHASCLCGFNPIKSNTRRTLPMQARPPSTNLLRIDLLQVHLSSTFSTASTTPYHRATNRTLVRCLYVSLYLELTPFFSFHFTVCLAGGLFIFLLLPLLPSYYSQFLIKQTNNPNPPRWPHAKQTQRSMSSSSAPARRD